MSKVGNNIKEGRIRKGYTQDQLAKALHVTRQTVSNWETGRNEPDLESLKILADILETDVSAILGEADTVSYRQMQKKYIRTALVSGVFSMAGFIANIWVEPSLRLLMQHKFNAIPYLTYSFGAVTFYLISMGICIGSIISLWKDLSVKAKQKWAFILIGIVLVTPALVTALQFVFYDTVIGADKALVFPIISMASVSVFAKFLTTGAPVLAGLSFFIGANSKKE